MTPDINFLQHRPLIRLNLKPAKQVKKAFHHAAVAISGAALVSAITGYGALMLGRNVPTALALGTLGSLGAAFHERLKEF